MTGKSDTDQQKVTTTILDQLPGLTDTIIQLVKKKAQDASFKARRAKVVIVLYMKAIYIGSRSSTPYESKLSTHSIDLQTWLQNFKNY